MSESTDPVCPQCGTPRAADGISACSCGRLASDAHRESRSSEAAAAEDFDPVRIRPFVKVGDDREAGDGARPEGAPEPVDDPTVALVGFECGPAGEPVGGFSAGPGEADERSSSGGDGGARGGRRRARLAIGAGALVVGVVAAGFVSGLFSYEGPSRGGTLPDDIRAELPEGATASGGGAPSPVLPSRTTSSVSPSPSDTSTASPSASPTESPTAGDASPTGSPGPSGSPAGGGQAATAGPAPIQSGEENLILRFGDTGPEVTELQLRLRQVGLYDGDVDGDYDRQIESAVHVYQMERFIPADEPGVYGTPTRSSLESETSEP